MWHLGTWCGGEHGGAGLMVGFLGFSNLNNSLIVLLLFCSLLNNKAQPPCGMGWALRSFPTQPILWTSAFIYPTAATEAITVYLTSDTWERNRDKNPARNKAWEQMKTSLWYENVTVIIEYNKTISKWLKIIKSTLQEVCIAVAMIGKWETMAVAQVWFCEWTLGGNEF